MRKTELQKTVDRILRALQPYQVEKRQKILDIVAEYLEEGLIEDSDGRIAKRRGATGDRYGRLPRGEEEARAKREGSREASPKRCRSSQSI